VGDLLAQIERAKDDPRQLLAIATGLEKANAALSRELIAQKLENARLRGEEVATLELELRFRTEQLAARERVLFGRSSERRSREEGAAGEPPSRGAVRGHGPAAQPALPMTEVVHELDAPDRTCPSCGGGLEAWAGQYEASEEIDVVARSFRLVVHRRQKYRCRCGGCVETAPAPPRLIPGGRYAIPFAVDVAVAKYADHLPLARQVTQMQRQGLSVTSQTLWDQLVALEARLEPSYEALVAQVLAAPVIGADETRWRVMGKGSKTWWAWSLWTEEAVVYRILASRSTQAARDLLGDYAGVVLCDGYSAYGALAKGTAAAPARDGPVVALAHCWAHVRRKFVEAEPHYPEAAEILEQIGRLYAIEREIRAAPAAEREAVARERRARDSIGVVRGIHDWLLAQRALPRSALGKAIAYTAGIWPGLCRFLDDPRIPIDNNGTERGMRALAVGRKNHYGSRSIHGTRVAALFYSLIESAKLAGIEPAAYLTEATLRAVQAPGTFTLPRDLAGR
jgi:transposase